MEPLDKSTVNNLTCKVPRTMLTVTSAAIVVMHIKGSTHIKQQCESSVTGLYWYRKGCHSITTFVEGVNSDQIQKNQMVIKTHNRCVAYNYCCQSRD